MGHLGLQVAFCEGMLLGMLPMLRLNQLTLSAQLHSSVELKIAKDGLWFNLHEIVTFR